MTPGSLPRRFINSYQGGFPLVEQPYRAAAADLGCSEAELIDCIRDLLDAGVLSRFGPLYDAARLGGGLTLAAMSVPDAHFDRVAAQVNAFPEVAHNYRREHNFNMWFVLATDTPAALADTLDAIRERTGLTVYDFPRQHEFYIGLWLQLEADGSVTTVPVPATLACDGNSNDRRHVADELDRRIIHITQTGIPLESCPWRTVAKQAGCTSLEVKQRLQTLLQAGILRRIGAVPNHYRLGLQANGMTVWDVPDDRVHAIGRSIGGLDFVSHCYCRPRRLPDWRYNLFAMVHGRDRGDIPEKIRRMQEVIGNACSAHDTLFSSAILKKTGMRLAA